MLAFAATTLAACAGAPADGPRQSDSALVRTVTLFQGTTSLRQEFDGRVPRRRIAVIALSDVDGMRVSAASPAQLYGEIARQVPGWSGNPAYALKIAAMAATGDGGSATLEREPDGSEVCIAFVGKPTETADELPLFWSGGALAGLKLARHFDALKLQRFAAYHEIGGHCADPAYTLAVNDSAYARARAEMRADVFAALAVMREDGTDETARDLATFREAASILAPAASDPIAGLANLVFYGTGPGIEAAIAWATDRPGSVAGLRGIDMSALLDAADAISARAMPDRARFEASTHRLARLSRTVREGHEPLGEALRRLVSAQDHGWYVRGAAAVKTLFGRDLLSPG